MNQVEVLQKSQMKKQEKNLVEDYGYIRYVPEQSLTEEKCSVAIYEIAPGKSNYPYHYHEQDMEIFYITEGTGCLTTPEGDRRIQKGDLILCPPCKRGAHRITNTSENEKLCYLEFDTLHKPEVIHYPETGKIGIIGSDGGNLFYREDNTIGYYETTVLPSES